MKFFGRRKQAPPQEAEIPNSTFTIGGQDVTLIEGSNDEFQVIVPSYDDQHMNRFVSEQIMSMVTKEFSEVRISNSELSGQPGASDITISPEVAVILDAAYFERLAEPDSQQGPTKEGIEKILDKLALAYGSQENLTEATFTAKARGAMHQDRLEMLDIKDKTQTIQSVISPVLARFITDLTHDELSAIQDQTDDQKIDTLANDLTAAITDHYSKEKANRGR